MMIEIGKRVDPNTLESTDEPVWFAPERLVRHAVCFGMTGSGKTGLCVTLLEELASAGVPLLVLDPKGDMANLALAFGQHRASDFLPWIDPAAAKRDGLSVEDYAEKVAKRWRDGLARDGVTAERIARFVEGAQVTVHTPGSTSGVAIDVLGGLGRCPKGLEGDAEGLQEVAGSTVSALLGLVGVDADPLRDPRHVVLAQLIEAAWAKGEDVSLEQLVLRLVDPPFTRVGVFPLESFYARNDRMDLAMKLNGVIASPAFAPWRTGVPLDIEAMLDGGGRTPVRVFSMGHLDEAGRTFFAALLLSRVLAWSRRQSGTSALRALVYFDEVFGFLPPHPKNPPTKRPVMTLMKQARAVGVGTMLVTQNPVDVDYSAMGNAGLWLLGRLQTEQDQARVLDGLASAGGELDRATIASWLERLPTRTFVVRDVEEPAPYLMRSRWAISYLRGPLTRQEIASITPDQPETAAEAAAPAGEAGLLPEPPAVPPGLDVRWLSPSVVFSKRLAPFFEGEAIPRRTDGKIVWKPAIWARLHLRFDEGRDIVGDREEHRLFFPLSPGISLAGEPEFSEDDLLPAGERPGGLYAPMPADLDEKAEVQRLQKQVQDDVERGETERFFRHTELKLASRLGESEADFRVRVREILAEKASDAQASLAAKVEKEAQRHEDKRTKLSRDLADKEAEHRSKAAGEAVNVMTTLYGMFFGRTRSVSSVVSKRQQTARVGDKIERLGDELGDIEAKLEELADRTKEQLEALHDEWMAKESAVEALDVGLERSDVSLDGLVLVWVPVTRSV